MSKCFIIAIGDSRAVLVKIVISCVVAQCSLLLANYTVKQPIICILDCYLLDCAV
jgi:hypothetical protein